MGLERLIRDGWFDTPDYELEYTLEPIKDKLILSRLLNKKKVLVSSRADRRIYEYTFFPDDMVKIFELPVCLSGTAVMANMTKDQLEQYLGVDFVVEESLVIKVPRVIPPTWWEKLFKKKK